MPTIYFPVSHNCWGHSLPQPAGLLQDAWSRDFRPWGNTKIQLTQQNTLWNTRTVCAPAQWSRLVQGKKNLLMRSISFLRLLKASPCHLNISFTYPLDAWQSPAETTSHLTAVFSLLGHQWVYSWKLPRVLQPQVILHHSVFLWTAPQMQVKTGTGSWHAYVDHDGRKPTSWHYSGTFCVPSLPAFWKSVHIYC